MSVDDPGPAFGTERWAAMPLASPSSFEAMSLSVLTPADALELSLVLDRGTWDGLTQQRGDEDVRRVSVQALPSGVFGDLTSHLRDTMLAVNDRHYHFDIEGYDRSDAPHALLYTPGAGHYGWHLDAGRTHPLRKLSMTLALSEPAEYQGGHIEITDHGTIDPLPAGSALIFPSYLAHRVQPVTAGRRMVVVTWLHGPSFR